MKKILAPAALLLAAAALGIAQEPPEAVLARMEKAFAAMSAFQADFEQTTASSTSTMPLTQTGRVFFRRPDAMRWEYDAPEKNVYVFKAGLLLSYFPEDNQLWKQRIPAEKYESEILSLLAGKGGAAQKYIVEDSPFPESAPGTAQLKLTPREEEGEYTYLLLEIDRKTAALRRVIFFDWGGNRSQFIFRRLKSGVRLTDSVFEIKVPPGCEIIDEAGPIKR
jgi:outer membrane lipoprotein carrier protein